MTMTAGPFRTDEEAFPGLDERVAEVTAPSADPTASAAQVSPWEDRARRLARSASRAAHVFPGVESARFDITGPPSEPTLELDCTLHQGQDTPSVIERLTHTVVEDLEELIGTEFAERHISVRVDPGGVPAQQALATAS